MAKVAFITGGSRGIGKACGLKLAKEGWDVVVAAKTTEPHPKLPGTIFTAAEEIEQYGTKVLAVKCDVTQLESVHEAAKQTLDTFGRIDAVINNAGALWWRTMDDTPMKRFDLVIDVNVRGAFAVTTEFLPTMLKQGSGHVINMSPPIDMGMLHGHIAYCVGKFGMTMMVHGMAEEFADKGIYSAALWPRTMIESSATINLNLGEPSNWRKADIIADATFEILEHPEETNGKALIDEEFLRSIGYTDFDQYLCVEGGEPMVISTPTMRESRS